jgi:FkbM family methyltransferase
MNITKRISFEGQSVNIPVISGLGYPNIYLVPGWFSRIANELFTDSGQTFIDVGANIGQTLIAVKSAGKDIQYVGFEPDTSCCHYIKKLIHINHFENCLVYNFGLSDRLKEGFLETNVEADPTGSLVQELRPNFFHQRESVFSLAYDSLNFDKKVGCIKIDVEGGELEVLMGMQKLISEDRPYILCEILDSFSQDVLAFTQQRADQVCSILKDHQYSIIQLVQSESTDRIVAFTELDVVTIKQWKPDSLLFNDYIFFPEQKRDRVIQMLTKLTS